MKTFVAVSNLRDPRELKREVLLFDQIVVPMLDHYLQSLSSPAWIADFEWLQENELVVGLQHEEFLKWIEDNESFSSLTLIPVAQFMFAAAKFLRGDVKVEPILVAALGGSLASLFSYVLSAGGRWVEEVLGARSTLLISELEAMRFSTSDKTTAVTQDLLAKLTNSGHLLQLQTVVDLICDRLRESGYSEEELLREPVANPPRVRNSVISVVLEEFPVPDDSVPWEQILDFKRDENTRSQVVRLRKWMRSLGVGERNPIELREELEYALESYKEHIRFHRLKTQQGTVETILSASADVAANLVKFQWTEAARSLLRFRQRKITLLEAERAAPCRDVAYILRAQEEFGRNLNSGS